jgi:hypothetical protein
MRKVSAKSLGVVSSRAAFQKATTPPSVNRNAAMLTVRNTFS